MTTSRLAIQPARSDLVRRHPIASFFVLAIGISWLGAQIPMLLASRGQIALPGWITPILLVLAGGPSIAGWIMTWLVGGSAGVRDLWQRGLRWRVSWRWYALVLLLPAAISCLAIAIHVLLGGAAPEFDFFRREAYLAPLLFLYILILDGPMLEEWGWRGFATPSIQARHGPRAASLAVGLAFGLWHLPQFITPGTTQYGMWEPLWIGIPIFVCVEIGWSSIMTWLYNRTGGSLLLSGLLMHASFNFWSATLLTNFSTTTAQVTSDPRLMYLWAGLLVLVAVGLIVLTRGRLGYASEEPGDRMVDRGKPLNLEKGAQA